jgi:hypothetical protein
MCKEVASYHCFWRLLDSCGYWDCFGRLFGCLWAIITDMLLASVYCLDVVILSRWFCSLLDFLLPVHSHSGGLQFFQCYRVHAVQSAKKRLPI